MHLQCYVIVLLWRSSFDRTHRL